MLKKIGTIVMLGALLLNAAIIKDKLGVKMVRINDSKINVSSKISAFSGVQGSTFDQSANGNGWALGFNRKVQTNMDPVTGPMIGSVYRQLNTTYGTGTIGGMIGVWGATPFQGYSQSIYTESIYNSNGSPGGRYPFTSEFINGYLFGLYNDYDNTITGSPEGQVSQPMFVVCDATFGWDLSMWSAPKRIEATEGGAVVPGAWLGFGDVVYNPADGYYYWTTGWSMGGLVTSWTESKTPFVSGRSNNPTDPDSWEWTDYNEIIMDCSDIEGIQYYYGDFQVAYAKDIQGNGSGKGVVVSTYVDDAYIMTNLAGDTLDVSSHERLGYMFTNNWGADNSTGDFKTNWATPGNLGNNLIPADVYKLFDWYGTEVTGDSIGVDGDGNAIYAKYPLNWPVFLANIDVVCTEENIVHVLTKVIGGSTEGPEFWFYTNDEKTIAGYYDIVGEITETGVVWKSANYIAAWMGFADDTEEMLYSNTNKLSIGYAGRGVVYVSWWDRPETRYLPPPADLTDPDSQYIDDIFFVYSADNGVTWDVEKTVTMPNETTPEMPYQLKYAFNVTKTNTLMDQGWNVSTHGTNYAEGTTNNGVMTVYAACQYMNPAAPIEDPILSYNSFEQYLKIWKINGTKTGIETEQVSMVKDFTLDQNYPNPFNPSTEIRFALQNDSQVKLAVFNTKGELVANLKNEKMAKGAHAVNFDATALNSGVYFYKLSVNGMTETKKMVLTK